MKWLFSIAFALAISASSIADEMPDEKKIVDGLNRHLAEIDCKTDAATWTREQTLYCISKKMAEIEERINEMRKESGQ